MDRTKGQAALLLMFVIMAIEEYGYSDEEEFLKDCRKAYRYRRSTLRR